MYMYMQLNPYALQYILSKHAYKCTFIKKTKQPVTVFLVYGFRMYTYRYNTCTYIMCGTCICTCIYNVYIRCIFQASFSEGERTVIQFHYTAWPDKNVPAQASPLLDFLRAINTANDPRKHGPIVVHCRSVNGRQWNYNWLCYTYMYVQYMYFSAANN